MKRPTAILLFSLALIAIISISVMIYAGISLKDELDVPEGFRCIPGEFESYSHPSYPGYLGEVQGAEKIELVTGEEILMCCSEGGADSSNNDIKYCSLSKDTLITHQVFYEKGGAEYVKSFEQIPQTIAEKEVVCEYAFIDGKWAGRTCF